MALVCPACGTANGDASRFCSNCASPLPAAAPAAAAPPPAPVPPQPVAPAPQAWAPAPPPSWTPPPGAPPPGWGQAPAGWPAGAVPPGYPTYAPAPAARRRPVGLLVGGAVVALLVLVGGGVAAASILSKPTPSPVIPLPPTPAPSTAVRPTPTPASSSGPVVTAPPVVIVTPGPVVTSQPTQAPQPTAPPNGQTVDVTNISVVVPPPWTVSDKQDYAITLLYAKKGAMSLVSGTLKTATTPTAWLQGVLADVQKNDPNAAFCKEPQDFQLANGPAGKIAAICYTHTPQGGQATKLVEVQAVGVDSAGTTLFIADIVAPDTNIDEVLQAADQVLPSVTWKLFKAG